MSNRAHWKLASATTLALLMAVPAGASTPEAVTDYVNAVLSIVPDILGDDPATHAQADTVREVLVLQAAQYHTMHDKVAALTVPEAGLQDDHQAVLNALAEQEQAALLAASLAPPDAVGTFENTIQYGHVAPDTGYARSDVLLARGGLQVAAFEYGYEYNGIIALPRDRTDTATLGSADAPVSTITIVHEPVVTDFGLVPNVFNFAYDTIYALEGAISFTFDNQNAIPFTYNLAIYDNDTRYERVTYDQLIAGTETVGGPKVHTLNLNLKRGIYSYVDNVHPNDLRGLLYVVDANGAVPEPATWAMMIAGFGLTGSAMRRRTGRFVRTA